MLEYIDLQCCVGFGCTAKCSSYIRTHVHSFSGSFLIQVITGLPCGSVVKNPPAMLETRRRRGSYPWVGKILWRRKWQPTPVFLPGKSHGQRSLAGYSPWVTKELDTTKKQQHKLSQTTGESSLFCKSTLIGCLSYT